jgi:hypothetical protein
MQSRTSDLETERSVLAKKIDSLETDLSESRRLQSAPGEPGEAAVAGQMRRQIADLQATVARLKRFENIYLAAKGAAKSPAEVASSFTVEGGQIVPEFDPSKPAGHA